MEPVGSSAFCDIVSTSLLAGGCVHQQEVPGNHHLRFWLLCDQRKTQNGQGKKTCLVMSSPSTLDLVAYSYVSHVPDKVRAV